MSEISGINIREVFDYRLSTASVYIDRRGGTWVCVVVSQNNPDHVEGDEPTPPLETHDTGIKHEKGDGQDTAKTKVCFEWFKSIRDKYARDNIEELKPQVAAINARQAKLAEALKGLSPEQARGMVGDLLASMQADESQRTEVEAEGGAP